MNNKYGVSYLTITGSLFKNIECLPFLLHSLYFANLNRESQYCEIELPNAAARLVLFHIKMWFEYNYTLMNGERISVSLNGAYTKLIIVHENFGLVFEVVEL